VKIVREVVGSRGRVLAAVDDSAFDGDSSGVCPGLPCPLRRTRAALRR
jgi:hypothetical protein